MQRENVLNRRTMWVACAVAIPALAGATALGTAGRATAGRLTIKVAPSVKQGSVLAVRVDPTKARKCWLLVTRGADRDKPRRIRGRAPSVVRLRVPPRARRTVWRISVRCDGRTSRVARVRIARGPDVPKPPPLSPTPVPNHPAPPSMPVPTIWAHWTALGEARPGDPVPAVEAKLGATFGPSTPLTNTCSYANTADRAFGVIIAHNGAVELGTAQAFIVRTPQVRMVGTAIGVGNTLDDVRAAYPNWAAGGGTNLSGGDNVYIHPTSPGQRPNHSARGRGAMFEADTAGVIQQFRVGAMPYVVHTQYCSSPE